MWIDVWNISRTRPVVWSGVEWVVAVQWNVVEWSRKPAGAGLLGMQEWLGGAEGVGGRWRWCRVEEWLAGRGGGRCRAVEGDAGWRKKGLRGLRGGGGRAV